MAKTYGTLNGLRGAAAIAVVLFHAKPLFGGQLVPGGYLAVDLFFCLSGFVIAHAYDDRLPTMGPLAFIWRRIVRFYPLYILGLILGAAMIALELLVHPPASMTWAQAAFTFFSGLFFLPTWGASELYPLNIPAWSLGLELVINILYAVFFRYLNRRVLVAVAVLSLAMLTWAVFDRGDASIGANVGDLGGGLARAIFSFTVGVLVFRSRWVPRFGNPLLLVTLLVVVLVLPVTSGPSPWRAVYDLFCIVALFPLMVACGQVQPSRLRSTFEYLGATSYCIYAIHYPLIWAAQAAAKMAGIPLLVAGVALIVGLLIACPLLDTYYDKPLRRRVMSLGRAGGVAVDGTPS